MKLLFTLLIFLCSLGSFAQNKVSKLPTGTYQTYFYGFNYSLNKWLRGDIILLSSDTYKMSAEKAIGRYKFAPGERRVYFFSGPLRNVYAKIALSSHQPAIVLPKKENIAQNIKLAVSDVWAYYKTK
jgi:hypothetical protein